jgi:lysophospholipase L1-like esterase
MTSRKYFTLTVSRRAVFIVAAVCGGLVVALGGVEILVRTFAGAALAADAPRLKLEGTDFYALTYDGELGWKNTPGLEALVVRDRKIEIRHDSHGFRNDEVAEKKPADVYRIVILGDSVAWGWGVDQGDVYSALLAQRLNERRAVGKRFEVVNAAVSGYGTAQELLLFRRIAAWAKPDLVLLHYFDNDVGDNCGTWDYGAARPVLVPFDGTWLVKNTPCPLRLPKPREPARLLRPAAGLWRAASYRLLVFRSLNRPGLARFFGRLGWWSIEPDTSIRLGGSSCIPATIGLIRRLNDEARAAGANFAVVFDARQDNVAAGIADLACLDLYPEFVRRNLRASDIRIPGSLGHFSPAGHLLMADLVGDFLTARGFVAPTPEKQP